MRNDTFLIDRETESVKVVGETDFYLYNHVKEIDNKQNSLSKLGVWVDYDFSWLHDKEWQLTKKDPIQNVVSMNNSYHHSFLALSVKMEEVIHPTENFYMRKIELQNHFNIRRNVRLFFYQNISQTYHCGGDTAFFAPKEQVLYHFQKNSCWLFNGMMQNEGIKQYTAFSQMSSKPLERHCFNKNEGVLFFNPIAKGYITSVFSLEAELLAFDKLTAYYWIASDKVKNNVCSRNEKVLEQGPDKVFINLKSDKRNNEGTYLKI